MTEQQATTLCVQLMQQHGLISSGWTFKLNNRARSLGICNYRKKTIELSKFFLHESDEQVRDTCLHEISHALVGPRAGHGFVWQMKAREIGAKPERCAEGVESTKPSKIHLHCEKCNWHRPIYRTPKRTKSCARCCPRYFNRDFILKVLTTQQLADKMKPQTEGASNGECPQTDS